ncbi:MAG: hypothetical protein K2X55_25195 [Burkholderiaceae bacterium]|nr:hypothetical protein [Burkholderiaceae bacterium]
MKSPVQSTVASLLGMRKYAHVTIAIILIIFGAVLIAQDSATGFWPCGAALVVALHRKVTGQPKATNGWWRQFGFALLMLICTAGIWYAVATSPSQCGFQHLQLRFFSCALTFSVGFTSVLTIWVVGICILCNFPNSEDTKDLYHSTPSWAAIKESGCIFPTADGRIYFLDRDEKLGKKAADGKDIKLIFSAAKEKGIAKKAGFGPFMYLRFKTGRGEWLADPYHYLTIDRFFECVNSSSVIIDGYTLKKATGRARWLLQIRRWSALIFISPIFVSSLIGALIFEKNFAGRLNWYNLWMLWIIVIVVFFVVVAYFLQNLYNKIVFNSLKI